MKIKILLLSVLAGLAALTAQAHSDEKKPAGPNGGRILKEARAEFLVTEARKVQITFLDDHHQAVAPAGQTVTVTAGERAAPTTLRFTRAGNAFLSDAALPDGASIPTVVQVMPAPDAKIVTEKFNVRLAPCPECRKPEYACICHGH